MNRHLLCCCSLHCFVLYSHQSLSCCLSCGLQSLQCCLPCCLQPLQCLCVSLTSLCSLCVQREPLSGPKLQSLSLVSSLQQPLDPQVLPQPSSGPSSLWPNPIPPEPLRWPRPLHPNSLLQPLPLPLMSWMQHFLVPLVPDHLSKGLHFNADLQPGHQRGYAFNAGPRVNCLRDSTPPVSCPQVVHLRFSAPAVSCPRVIYLRFSALVLYCPQSSV